VNRFFDIDELDQEEINETPEERSGAMIEKFIFFHYERISSIKQLAGRLPGLGEIYFLWTINSFNAFTFIQFIIKECGNIDELIVSTYSINIRIIDALMKLIDRRQISSVKIFISDSIRTRLPKVYDHLTALVEKRSSIIQVIYSWNHSKISLIRIGNNYFDVEGSGNWGENAQHEQYIFLNSLEVFEFRKNEILNGINS
jgi:hypothetical protein